MRFISAPTFLRQMPAMTAVALCLAACASAPEQAPRSIASASPSHGVPADTANLDIANVKLGMTAEQAIAGLRQAYGQNIRDWKVADQSIIDILKINKDMNYPRNVIFFSTYLPGKSHGPMYINHIFYNIDTTYIGEESVIIDLAIPPGQVGGPARVYQVLQIARTGQPRGTVFDEIGGQAMTKYGSPTRNNAWCAGPMEDRCPADKPYLALHLIDDPAQRIKSVLQLYDPGYGQIGPEAVGSTGDVGTLSFQRHTDSQ